MKNKFLIIAFLIASLFAAFSLKAACQTESKKKEIWFDRAPITMKIDSAVLIGDETTITWTKTGAKITTYSEAAFQAISLKWGDEFKSINIKYKTDRHGKYKEYTIYLSKETANNITQWAKKNL